jgi:hypothetical protein
MSIQQQAYDLSTPTGLTIASAVLPCGAASVTIVVPTQWVGKFLSFSFVGAASADIGYVRFGTAASVACTTSSTNSTVTGTPGVLTEAGTEPMLTIPHGMTVSHRLDNSVTHFAHIASAASGKLIVVMTTGDSA